MMDILTIDLGEWQMYKEKFAETLSTDYFMGNFYSSFKYFERFMC